MAYYRDEKSSGLMPIVAALSIVAIVGFGACYYFNGQVEKQDAEAPVVTGSTNAVHVNATSIKPVHNRV